MGTSLVTGDLYLKGGFDTITSHQELTSLTDNPVLKKKGLTK